MKLMLYVFLLLMVNVAINGMEITVVEKALHNCDVVSNIAKQLCLGRLNKYIRDDFKAWCCTNNFFSSYFSEKKNKQIIIRTIVRNNYDDDRINIATLRCHLVYKQITGFCHLSVTDYNTAESLLSDYGLKVILEKLFTLSHYVQGMAFHQKNEVLLTKEEVLGIVQQHKILLRLGATF